MMLKAAAGSLQILMIPLMKQKHRKPAHTADNGDSRWRRARPLIIEYQRRQLFVRLLTQLGRHRNLGIVKRVI